MCAMCTHPVHKRQHSFNKGSPRFPQRNSQEYISLRITKIPPNKKQQCPPIHGQNGIAYSDEEIADGFAYSLF